MKVYRSAKSGQMIHRTYDELLRQWDVKIEERTLASCYGTTHVIVAGEQGNMPLVCFHGVGDDSALMWLYNAKALSAKYRIYAVDTIGGPGKSKPGAKYGKGFDDAEWIDTILDALGLNTVGMLGTSHGAYLIQYYGVMRPQRVEKMVCLAGTVPAGSNGPMKTMMKIFLPEALFPTQKNTAKLLRKLCGENVGVFLDNPTIMAHYQWLLKGFNNMAMQHHTVRPFSDQEIERIKPKTLYLNGNDDPFQLLGGREPLLSRGMQCKFFDHVGHGINHEISSEINKIILDAF